MSINRKFNTAAKGGLDELTRDLHRLLKTKMLSAGGSEKIRRLIGKPKKPMADLNARDRNGDTALLMAIRRGRRDFVEAIMRHDVDINVRDKNGENGMTRAAHMNRPDIMLLLLNSGRLEVTMAPEDRKPENAKPQIKPKAP